MTPDLILAEFRLAMACADPDWLADLWTLAHERPELEPLFRDETDRIAAECGVPELTPEDAERGRARVLAMLDEAAARYRDGDPNTAHQ